MPALRRLGLVCLLLTGALALSACTGTVSMEPAKNANDPLCAEITVRLPDAVGHLDRQWTDAQATGAWGDPVAVALTCGLDAPAPTAEFQCVSLEGVDWLVDAEDTPYLRMTSYGRQPAVEIYVNTTPGVGISSNEALKALGPIVTHIPATSRCISPDELPE